MDPKVKLALVQAGLIRATASEEEANAALALHFSAIGKPIPTKVEEIVASVFPVTTLEATIEQTAPAIQPPAPVPTGATNATNNAQLSITDISGLVMTAGASLSSDEKLELVNTLNQQFQANRNLSVQHVLDTINARATAANPPAGHSPNIEVTAQARDKFMAAARDAVVLSTMRGSTPEQIYNFRSGEMVDWKPDRKNYGLATPQAIARQCLVHAGIPHWKVDSLSPYHLANLMMGADPLDMGLGFLASADGPAYNVTGMFSNIMLDAQNVTLRRSFDEARTSFQIWMHKGPDIANFKDVHRVIAGELGDPKAIPEDGTFEETTMTDGKEKYSLTVWGEVFSKSWQLIVNDDLGAFTVDETRLGNAMKRKLNRIAYGTLKDNAALADTGLLFNSTATTTTGGHNNLTTGALTTSADYASAWSTMKKKMRTQKGLSAQSSVLNLSPRFIIHPSSIADIIQQTLGSESIALATQGNERTINVHRNTLERVEEAELDASTTNGSDTAFYLAADSMDVDTIEYAYLAGLPAPVIERQPAFDRLAFRTRIYFAFGVKPLDFRGMQKHTGAS